MISAREAPRSIAFCLYFSRSTFKVSSEISLATSLVVPFLGSNMGSFLAGIAVGKKILDQVEFSNHVTSVFIPKSICEYLPHPLYPPLL
jgi:hypothetical protein